MWTVIYFKPVRTTQTRVTVKMMGWTADESSQKMRGFFAAGNAYVLKELQKDFTKSE